MIDNSKIRLAFRAKFLSGTSPLFSEGDCAFEGQSFDPQGKTLWLRETLLPVNGDAATDSDERLLAIMQYDLFTPHSTGTETLDAKLKDLADLFEPSEEFPAYSGVVCAVDSVDPTKLDTDNPPWDSKGIRITFRAYNG